MPDQNGVLSDKEKDQAIAWLKERWTKSCPACDRREFSIGEHVVHTPIHFGGALKFGGPMYPQLAVVCKNCGYTLLFNAVLMGIIESKEEIKEESEKNGEVTPPKQNARDT